MSPTGPLDHLVEACRCTPPTHAVQFHNRLLLKPTVPAAHSPFSPLFPFFFLSRLSLSLSPPDTYSQSYTLSLSSFSHLRRLPRLTNYLAGVFFIYLFFFLFYIVSLLLGMHNLSICPSPFILTPYPHVQSYSFTPRWLYCLYLV